jgi:hypothetical protein
MNVRFALWLVCPALALLHGSAEPRFAPAKGLRVAKEIVATSQVSLEDWGCVMNGNEVPAEYLPQLTIETTHERRVGAVDEFVESRDGRALKLRRTYDALSAKDGHTVNINDQPLPGTGEKTGKTALGGCTVLFDDSASGDARRKLEHGECERGVLDKLWIDLDLTALLPTRDGMPSWSVDAKLVNPFQADFGGIAFEFEKVEGGDRIDLEQLAKNADGHWTITRGAEREENGAKLLVLPIQGAFTSHCSRVALLEHVPNITGEASEKAEEKLESKGELVWDLTHNCLHSASIEHAVHMEFKTTRLPDGTPNEPTYEQTMNFKGAAKLEITAKIVD